MLDIGDLEAKAKAAMSANPGVGQWDYDQGHDELNAGGFIIADVWDESCGEFIAAANPAIVLALIRELREARAALSKALDWDDHRLMMPLEINREMRAALRGAKGEPHA